MRTVPEAAGVRNRQTDFGHAHGRAAQYAIKPAGGDMDKRSCKRFCGQIRDHSL
jgi:hypothetical protein